MLLVCFASKRNFFLLWKLSNLKWRLVIKPFFLLLKMGENELQKIGDPLGWWGGDMSPWWTVSSNGQFYIYVFGWKNRRTELVNYRVDLLKKMFWYKSRNLLEKKYLLLFTNFSKLRRRFGWVSGFIKYWPHRHI